MSAEYDRAWHQIQVTEQEDAEWQRLWEQRDRADDHAPATRIHDEDRKGAR